MTKKERLLRFAFSAGQTWGVTYSGWFTPTAKDTEKAYQEMLINLEKREKKG